MAGFDKDDYLNNLPDAGRAAGSSEAQPDADRPQPQHQDGAVGADNTADQTSQAQGDSEEVELKASADADKSSSTSGGKRSDAGDSDVRDDKDDQGNLTPLGQAKKEAAEYLDALQRERAEFVNYRNRSKKEQDTFRQHGIIDVLTAMLPALDDVDRIREHGDLDDSFNAVATKIDRVFEKFGVKKFGQKGDSFDPTKYEAILHKPDKSAQSETVDTVVEAGYRIGDRVVRAARVVVASPNA